MIKIILLMIIFNNSFSLFFYLFSNSLNTATSMVLLDQMT